MRYFLALSYDGGAYNGWQRQKSGLGVQQIVEESLAKLLKKEHIITVAAGRTDAGVHARRQFVHFDVETDLPQSFAFKLNCILPHDIGLSAVYECGAPPINARFDARSREYHYHIRRKKSPFAYGRSLPIFYALNFDLMQEAAAVLLNYNDFASFAKEIPSNSHTLCNIYIAEWLKGEDEFIFRVKANRFLRGMVRALVGALLEVGKEKITISNLCKIIEAKDRTKAPPNVGPYGLFLHDVVYPEGALSLYEMPYRY